MIISIIIIDNQFYINWINSLLIVQCPFLKKKTVNVFSIVRKDKVININWRKIFYWKYNISHIIALIVFDLLTWQWRVWMKKLKNLKNWNEEFEAIVKPKHNKDVSDKPTLNWNCFDWDKAWRLSQRKNISNLNFSDTRIWTKWCDKVKYIFMSRYSKESKPTFIFKTAMQCSLKTFQPSYLLASSLIVFECCVWKVLS